jgi:hypothetical protein
MELHFDPFSTESEINQITHKLCKMSRFKSFNPRFEQTTSTAHIFSKIKVFMEKYLKKSCSY